MKNILFTILGVVFLLILGCKAGLNESANSDALPPLIVDFDSCKPLDGGCTVYFRTTGPVSSFTSPFQLSKIFGSKKQKLAASPNATISLTSVTMTNPNLFYTDDDVVSQREVPEEWFSRTLECTYAEGTFFGVRFTRLVKCENFFPVGAVAMTGVVTSSQVPSVLTGAQLLPKDLRIIYGISQALRFSDSVVPCGNNSAFTTYQNLALCNATYAGNNPSYTILPKSSAGFGNAMGGSTPFTTIRGTQCPTGFNCEPDKNWFLVSCPGTASTLDSCSWLSPIITTDNPAAGVGGYDSNLVSMTDLALDPNSTTYAQDRLTKGRFLWSGTLPQNYNFFEANGKNARMTSPDPSYNFYPLVSQFIKLLQQNQGGTPDMNGPLILAPGFVSGTVPVMANGAANIYLNAYNAVNSTINVCQTAQNNSSSSLPQSSLSTYNWQVPSYPMLYTLTGGGTSTEHFCEVGGNGYDSDGRAVCNIALSGVSQFAAGFRAIDPLPGFFSDANFLETLISSSVSDPADPGVAVLTNTDAPLRKGSVGFIPSDQKSSVKCVSTIW